MWFANLLPEARVFIFMKKNLIRSSKFLSLVLRHQPDLLNLELDSKGWLEIDSLILRAQEAGHSLSRGVITEVVDSNDKQRFELSEDGLRIRARQGHSVRGVDPDLQSVTPPATLYHGTVARFLPSIRQNGLLKQSRNHVHLSAETQTAIVVANRRGEAVVLAIDAAAMAHAGHTFFLSANGVWLTEDVPSEFIAFPN